MASSSINPGFPVLPRSAKRRRTRQCCMQVRARQDEGRHIVDANMRQLKERMEGIRVKESLERCLTAEHGWNHGDYQRKQPEPMTKASREFIELVAMVVATFGFPILSGTFCLCLVSILVHLNQ